MNYGLCNFAFDTCPKGCKTSQFFLFSFFLKLIEFNLYKCLEFTCLLVKNIVQIRLFSLGREYVYRGTKYLLSYYTFIFHPKYFHFDLRWSFRWWFYFYALCHHLSVMIPLEARNDSSITSNSRKTIGLTKTKE